MPPRALTRHETLSKRRFWTPRPSPLPVPDVGIDDAPCVCIQINTSWASHILGLFELLMWEDAWAGTDDDIQRAIDTIIEVEAMAKCPCPGDGRATQSIDNTLKLKLLVENNFNFNALVPGLPDTTFTQNTGDDATERAQREAALCWALTEWMLGMLQAFRDDLATTAILTMGISTVAGLLTGGIGVALTGAAAGAAIAALETAVDDKCAMRNVIACAFQNLKDRPITRDDYRAALNACDFDFLSNEDILKALVARPGLIASEFLTFLQILDGARGKVDIASLPDDQCVPCVTCDDFDIDLTATSALVEIVSGTFVAGTGIVPEETSPGIWTAQIKVHYETCCNNDNICLTVLNPTSSIGTRFWFWRNDNCGGGQSNQKNVFQSGVEGQVIEKCNTPGPGDGTPGQVAAQLVGFQHQNSSTNFALTRVRVVRP